MAVVIVFLPVRGGGDQKAKCKANRSNHGSKRCVLCVFFREKRDTSPIRFKSYLCPIHDHRNQIKPKGFPPSTRSLPKRLLQSRLVYSFSGKHAVPELELKLNRPAPRHRYITLLTGNFIDFTMSEF